MDGQVRHMVFLLLTVLSGGESQPIVAMLGDDVILPCHLDPPVNAVSATVEWGRADLEPRFVHVRRDGVELLIDQNPLFISRTFMSTDAMRCGDLSLRLSRVGLKDEGTYRCIVPPHGTRAEVQLVVGVVSSPVVSVMTLSSSDDEEKVDVECSSGGWYPEPEVLWLDGEGQVLSAGPPETVRGPDDLYTVSSRVTVEKRHSNSFTCRVHQKDTNLTRDTTIRIKGGPVQSWSCPVVRLVIVALVGFSCFLVLLFGTIIGGRERTRKSGEADLQRKELSVVDQGPEVRPLKSGPEDQSGSETGDHLDEEIRRSEVELVEVKNLIDKLDQLKKDLRNQKDKISSVMDEMLNKRRRDDNVVEKRKRRVEIQDEMMETAGRMTETLDHVFGKMMEMKGRLHRQTGDVRRRLEEETPAEGQTPGPP